MSNPGGGQERSDKGIPRGGGFDKPLPEGVGQATLGVRGGLMRSGFDENAEALYLSSGFVYESAGAAEQAFTGDIDHFVYSRYVRGAAAVDRGGRGVLRYLEWNVRGVHRTRRTVEGRRPIGRCA